MFLIHALDADCLLRPCHCEPSSSCSVPVTVKTAEAVVVPQQLTRLDPPRLERTVEFPEQPSVAPPQPAPPLLGPPRAPPA